MREQADVTVIQLNVEMELQMEIKLVFFHSGRKSLKILPKGWMNLYTYQKEIYLRKLNWRLKRLFS